MDDPRSAESREYVCAHCRKQGAGRYLAGGFWQYPMSWYVHDDADQLVCSAACARALARDARAEVRRRSGERAKFVLGAPKVKAPAE